MAVAQILHGQAANAGDNNTRYYAGVGNRLYESLGSTHAMPVRPGTASKLRVELNLDPGGAAARTYALMKNGSATGATFVIPAGSVYGEDLVNSVHYDNGDLMAIREVPSGSPTAGRIIGYSVDWEPDTPNESFYGSHFQQVGVATNVRPWLGGHASTAVSTSRNVIGIACSIAYWRVLLNGNPGVGNGWTWTPHVNGVPLDGTGGMPDARITIINGTVGSASFSPIALVPGDIVHFTQAAVGSPSVLWSMAWTTAVVADTPGEFMLPVANGTAGVGTALTYNDVVPRHILWAWDTTEANRRAKWLSDAPVRWTTLYAKMNTAPGAGVREFGIGRNGAYTTGLTDATDLAVVPVNLEPAAGDFLSIRTSASAGTLSSLHYTLGVAILSTEPPPVEPPPMQRASYVLFSRSITERQVETRLTKTCLQLLAADPPAVPDPVTLGLVQIVGNIYDQEGNLVTYGRLHMTPRSAIGVGDELIGPNTVTYDVTGYVTLYLAPSNGVLYDVEFDADPADTETPMNMKRGYFTDVWNVPALGPVNIEDL